MLLPALALHSSSLLHSVYLASEVSPGLLDCVTNELNIGGIGFKSIATGRQCLQVLEILKDKEIRVLSERGPPQNISKANLGRAPSEEKKWWWQRYTQSTKALAMS